VAFTGGIETAGASRRPAAPVQAQLIETSGNDPFIVMPSAPLDVAARGAAFGAFLNCGQVCAAAERFYVHERIYNEFAERLCITPPRSGRQRLDQVDMGPLASQRELARYLRILEARMTVSPRP